MKKEKWMLGEIARWEQEEIISPETADTLKSMYQPKKSLALLIVLFSVIGTIFIGLGIILIGANNWWYSLPRALRATIAFLPLLGSQALFFYTHKKKRDSTAWREGSAILNMAGIFSTVALIHQIFNIPMDLSDYLLICGVLSFPSMVLLNAVSPLVVYYWAALNGGFCIESSYAPLYALLIFIPGAVYAALKFKKESPKAIYLSLLTLVTGFIYILVAAIMEDFNFSMVLLAFLTLVASVAFLFEKTEKLYTSIATGSTIITMAVLSYEWSWDYSADMDGFLMPVLIVVLLVGAAFSETLKIRKDKKPSYALVPFAFLILRSIWAIFGLSEKSQPTIFMIITNALIFGLSLYLIVNGARKIKLLSANAGMVTLCYIIVARFFDSELPLIVRGFIFLFLGIGFLLFNLYLVIARKKIKGGAGQ